MRQFNDYPQDSIAFTIMREKTLTNETVRMTVPVAAIVRDGQSENDLRAGIKAALNRFIATTWAFGAIIRTVDASGQETVALRATSRVPEHENHNLVERVRAVSVKGLTLQAPEIDYTVPTNLLEDAQRELRKDLVKVAIDELDEMVSLTNRAYRLGSIEFHAFEPDVHVKSSQRNANFVTVTSMNDAPDDDSLGSSQRIAMRASVTFNLDFIKE